MSSCSNRRAAVVAAFVVALLLTGCGDPTGAGRLSARYVLISVDGAPLPFTTRDVRYADGRRLRSMALADTIRLVTEADFHRTLARYEEFSPTYPSDTSQWAMWGTYAVSGDSLLTYWTTFGPPPAGEVGMVESFFVAPTALRIQRQVGPYCVDPALPCTGTERMVDYLYAAR